MWDCRKNAEGVRGFTAGLRGEPGGLKEEEEESWKGGRAGGRASRQAQPGLAPRGTNTQTRSRNVKRIPLDCPLSRLPHDPCGSPAKGSSSRRYRAPRTPRNATNLIIFAARPRLPLEGWSSWWLPGQQILQSNTHVHTTHTYVYLQRWPAVGKVCTRVEEWRRWRGL